MLYSYLNPQKFFNDKNYKKNYFMTFLGANHVEKYKN